jgi:hypothetical protein
MEATCSSETPVDFQQTTRRYIPEARTLRFLTCLPLRLIDWPCVLCGADQQGNLTCFGIHCEPLLPSPPSLRMPRKLCVWSMASYCRTGADQLRCRIMEIVAIDGCEGGWLSAREVPRSGLGLVTGYNGLKFSVRKFQDSASNAATTASFASLFTNHRTILHFIPRATKSIVKWPVGTWIPKLDARWRWVERFRSWPLYILRSSSDWTEAGPCGQRNGTFLSRKSNPDPAVARYCTGWAFPALFPVLCMCPSIRWNRGPLRGYS